MAPCNRNNVGLYGGCIEQFSSEPICASTNSVSNSTSYTNFITGLSDNCTGGTLIDAVDLKANKSNSQICCSSTDKGFAYQESQSTSKFAICCNVGSPCIISKAGIACVTTAIMHYRSADGDNYPRCINDDLHTLYLTISHNDTFTLLDAGNCSSPAICCAGDDVGIKDGNGCFTACKGSNITC